MKKHMRNYPVTAILGGLASLLFAVQLVWAGFTVYSALEYPAVLCALLFLCPHLERWLGSKKMGQLLCATSLFALLTGCTMMLFNRYSFAQIFTLDLVNGIYLINLLAGIALTLSFTGGDKPNESFHLRPAAWIMTALLLLGSYAGIILNEYGFASIPAPNWFFFVYTLSVGAFGGMYFSWQNQRVTNRGVFNQTRVLPPHEKIKFSRFPGTLCLLGAILAIAIFTVIDMPPWDVFLGGFSRWRIDHVVPWAGVNLETLSIRRPAARADLY